MIVAGLALLVLTIADGPGASVTAISPGVGLGVVGLAPSPIELAEVGRLLAGAVLFMSSAGILAASRGR